MLLGFSKVRNPTRVMTATEVRLENIGKRYGDSWVVRGVNLHIAAGEFFTFLGPSGCGKTTLLRTIAGFVAADEGLVLLDGRPVNDVPPWQRDVGMVFQNYALWPHLSVFENVAFGLRERKVGRAEVERRVIEALEQVKLKGTEARRPSQLSGGQQQRVALARTLVIQPRVLLLDEPLSNLDAKLRAEMRLELLILQRDLGLTTIYVTHDQEEALAMSTRIAVMNQGRIVQEGKPREIYEESADQFVAAFVGQSNLLPAKIQRLNSGRVDVALSDGLVIALPFSGSARQLQPGDAVTLSIRPEAIEITLPGALQSDLNRLKGTIVASVYQGAFVEYEVLAVGKTLKARATNPRGKSLFQRGDEVALMFSSDDMLLVLEDAAK